ncbi:hypothetical protein KSS87_006069 [Heliosperma pusillum]|nr:hypothetical protein KSS87_006069 [Heliosperma pusillum]
MQSHFDDRSSSLIWLLNIYIDFIRASMLDEMSNLCRHVSSFRPNKSRSSFAIVSEWLAS